MKRLLFLIHRWGGVALALFMALWFLSGLIIVFAEPPTPTRAQLLAHAELLAPQAGWLSAGEAWDASASRREELARRKAPAGTDRPGGARPSTTTPELAQARLVRQAGEPVWLVEDTRGQRVALSAVDAAPRTTTPAQAVAIARSWVAPERAPAVRHVETLDRPAILRNAEALRPFHRVALEDGAGGELLVSAVTGEVVSASTRLQRALFWTGNWVHLFRPLDLLGATNDTRVTTLEWTAFLAVVACLTGLVVGWLRWRPGWFGRPRYARGGAHPYRERWWRWHFWAGLVGGTFALAWALSGFLSNNPWRLFSPAAPARDELARYAGAAAPGVARSWRAEPAAAPVAADVVELQWARVGDATVLLAHGRDGARRPQPAPGASARFDEAVLTAAVRRAAGGAAIAGQSTVGAYDTDYYLRHHRDAADRPLPALRVDLADAARTRVYLDPQDGRVLLKTDRSRRAFRWLYSALHHWDVGFLYRRPLWDAWMVSWIALGLVLSVSSVVLAWRRVALTARRAGRRAAGAAPSPATDAALGEGVEAG
jgi:uncharacterized iron-regulated membrane protein